MSALNIALLTVGGLVLVLGLFSSYLRHTIFSEPLIALAVGVLLGPAALGLLDVASSGSQELILEQAARLTLAIGLMGVALRIPVGYALQNWRPLLTLLGLIMPLMWLSSGLLTYLLLGLPFWLALLVGAIVTPTDPIVSSSIVVGNVAERNLPDRIRYILSAESGFNDGLAYPFVLLPILLLTRSHESPLLHWLLHTILWQVGAAVVFGLLLGYAAGRVMEWSEAKQMMEPTSFLAYTLALSLTVLGAAKLIGTDGILSVFVAGLAFDTAVKGGERAQEERVQEAVNRFFTLPIFVLIGLALPWQAWFELGWKGIGLAGAVLLLRRLPALLALRPLLRPIDNTKDALFLGWFGPIGVAALYYSSLALRETGVEQVWAVASLVISASIIAHGLTSTPFIKLYGRYTQNSSAYPQHAQVR